MNYGNPKRSSRFICCKHLGENFIGQGIQRGGNQREKGHTKDMFCIQCQEITKNVEIRWRDTYEEAYEKALQVRNQYYAEKTENNTDREE